MWGNQSGVRNPPTDFDGSNILIQHRNKAFFQQKPHVGYALCRESEIFEVKAPEVVKFPVHLPTVVWVYLVHIFLSFQLFPLLSPSVV